MLENPLSAQFFHPLSYKFIVLGLLGLYPIPFGFGLQFVTLQSSLRFIINNINKIGWPKLIVLFLGLNFYTSTTFFFFNGSCYFIRSLFIVGMNTMTWNEQWCVWLVLGRPKLSPFLDLIFYTSTNVFFILFLWELLFE